MENQLILNILISLIIGVSIAYFYLQKINSKFALYSTIIFLSSFIILYCLGPQSNMESFHNLDEENSNFDEENSNSSEENANLSEENINLSEESMNLSEESMNLSEESMNLSEENDEEFNQEEILYNQEEHIRNSIEEEEIEEEDNNDNLKKKIAKKNIVENKLFNKTISGNNNQFNPGIGVGISPVNIYINGNEVDVDKFKNNKEKSKKSDNKEKCDNNYFKKATRIYNNCDWVKDKKEWCDGTYNYDNNCGKNDNLLPCNKTEVTKIPQSLNNLINSKKTTKNSEPCPLDTNKPWSIYKTGDDKENNEIIPEGFNL
jgi:hypothetical protein